MINFVICDDNTDVVKKVSKIVDGVMINNEIDYRKHIYYDYDEKFVSEAIDNKIPNKVYILDIQAKTHSGIDIARKIRKNDVDSVIIFLTSFNELGMNVLNDELMVLTFINKLDNGEKRLISAIEKSLNILNVKSVLRFKDQGIIYTIPARDILYITRDTIDRKCIIKTEYNEFKVKMSLAKLLETLGNNFQSTHRACIVNMKRVRTIDRKRRVITFDSGDITNLMSNNFKKEVGIE